MAKARDLSVAAIAILTACAAESSAYHLRGRIVHVGFPAAGSDSSTLGSDHYVVGAWTPVLVELVNDQGDLFNGWIEVRQKDRDGDQVVARKDVSVRGTRRDYLFIPGGSYENAQQFNVRVFHESGGLAELHDDQNEKVFELEPVGQVVPIEPERRVVLDMSPRPLQQLRSVSGEGRLIRDLVVARTSPDQLPENVAGLDMVDTIVWDGCDPKDIDLPQRDALMQWMQRGGTLVLGVGRNWLEVSKSRFGDFLPAPLKGTSSLAEPSVLGRDVADLVWFEPDRVETLSPPVIYCPISRGALAANATSLVPDRRGGSDEPILAAQMPVGRGRLILVAAEIQDLLRDSRDPGPLLRQLLAVQRDTTRDDEETDYYGGSVDLFRYVERATAFQVTAGLYFLFAFAFVVGYIALATAGSWFWLRHRGKVQHAWTAFALIAVLSSAASLAAVQMIRGIGNSVEEMAIIDGQAGSFDAQARCYLGLKSAAHVELDLKLPSNWLEPVESEELPAALLPLAPDPDAFQENVFAARQRYQAEPIMGELLGVPMRATLKQFQAEWSGRMGGRLNARLRATGSSTAELTPDSWIENALGTDLDNCYLLVASKAFDQADPQRGFGTCVYWLGSLEEGQRFGVRGVSDALMKQARSRQKKDKDSSSMLPSTSAKEQRDYLHLDDTQRQWLSRFSLQRQDYFYRGDEQEEKVEINAETVASALLLISTFDEIEPGSLQAYHRRIRRSQGQDLACTSRLAPETALFFGFGRDPGPARLCVKRAGDDPDDYDAITPSQSRVMYRIVVPVERPD